MTNPKIRTYSWDSWIFSFLCILLGKWKIAVIYQDMQIETEKHYKKQKQFMGFVHLQLNSLRQLPFHLFKRSSAIVQDSWRTFTALLWLLTSFCSVLRMIPHCINNVESGLRGGLSMADSVSFFCCIFLSKYAFSALALCLGSLSIRCLSDRITWCNSYMLAIY